MDIQQVLINKINTSYWWHVPPRDKDAYKKRGKFLASTYMQAEFYGRPNNEPEKVAIANPIWSDSEIDILARLFPDSYQEKYERVVSCVHSDYYQNRIDLDAQMHRRAKELGYDAIVLLGSSGIKELRKNRKPRSIELNVCV
jgi:hypothetical protein